MYCEFLCVFALLVAIASMPKLERGLTLALPAARESARCQLSEVVYSALGIFSLWCTAEAAGVNGLHRWQDDQLTSCFSASKR